MSVEELAGIVGVDSRVLQPNGKVSFIQALTDELGIATCASQIHTGVDMNTFGDPTMWWVYVSDVGIVRRQSCPEIHSRGATKRNGTKVVAKGKPLIDKVFLHMWLVREGVETKVLIVDQDEDDVGIC